MVAHRGRMVVIDGTTLIFGIEIFKDDITSGFKRVVEDLGTIANVHRELEDNSNTFTIKKSKKRKLNEVDLPGYEKNGLVMKP